MQPSGSPCVTLGEVGVKLSIMIPSLPVPRLVETASDAVALAALSTQGRPIVMPGRVSHWPLVQAGSGLAAYLRQFESPQPVSAFVGAPDMKGRFFYSDDLKGFNFERIRLSLSDLLERLAVKGPEYLYAGAIPAPTHLPGLAETNLPPLLDPSVERLTSLWLGNRTRTAAHWDLAQNLACVVAGRRRFILFPPDQVSNLYIGPLENTLAGQPVSMVDFANPDLVTHSRFIEAMSNALVADLEPGDVLYIPSLWFHHVESIDDFGALVNFWWRGGPEWMVTPQFTLYHALLTIRDLPPRERESWRAFFDHYIFQTGSDPMEHLPVEAQGLMGPVTPQSLARIKAMLMGPLSR
jgi:hypothetical protein